MKSFDRSIDAAKRTRAFSRIELVVILAVVAILLTAGMSTGAKAHAKARRISCINNLAHVRLAYRIFATDNHGVLPWQVATNPPPPKTFDNALARFLSLSNELSTPWILCCPADTRKPARTWAELSRSNMSYFIGSASSEKFQELWLVGDRNLTTNGVAVTAGVLKLSSVITNIGWDKTIHNFQGNVVVGDGSLQQLNGERFKEELRKTGAEFSTLAIP